MPSDLSLNGNASHAPATLDDIADALGIHKSTVSVALSGKKPVAPGTRERVRAMARELGYEPNPVAQRLAIGRDNNAVCLLSAISDIGQSAAKVLRIQQELAARSLEAPSYSIPPWTSGRDLADVQVTLIRQVVRQRPRAIILAAMMVQPAAFEELARFQRAGGILVTYDAPAPLACDQVLYDREDNAYRVARHLLEQGHRRLRMGVSHSWWRDPNTATDPMTGRARGFQRALREAGIPVGDDSWLFRESSYEEGGIELARAYLALDDRPTAVAVINDYVAMGFMVELMRAGVRVPDELSIAGHDNQSIAAFCPVPLTSGTHPVERIAQSVVELLVERLNGHTGPHRTVTIRGDLIVRGSVGPPPRPGPPPPSPKPLQ